MPITALYFLPLAMVLGEQRLNATHLSDPGAVFSSCETKRLPVVGRVEDECRDTALANRAIARIEV